MKKEKQFFITCITLILLAMTVLVSCGDDPFFHHVTVNNYRGEAVNCKEPQDNLQEYRSENEISSG